MSQRKQKLELTWIGKEVRPKLEPRILIEDPARSYVAAARVTNKDIFDNRLIFGDNLLALKALEAEFTGKVKCIYIDPPYNTGSAFEHYDDGIEHSLWLSLMRDRLEILRKLLQEDGSIWITIDDHEYHYLKLVLDEVFGRDNFVSSVVLGRISTEGAMQPLSLLATTTCSFTLQWALTGNICDDFCRAMRRVRASTQTLTTIQTALGDLARFSRPRSDTRD